MAREQRKLAAILAADVVGYFRLMGRDEAGTLVRRREHRNDRLEPVLRDACITARILGGSPVRPQSKFLQHLLAQLREARAAAMPRVRQVNQDLRQNSRRPGT